MKNKEVSAPPTTYTSRSSFNGLRLVLVGGEVICWSTGIINIITLQPIQAYGFPKDSNQTIPESKHNYMFKIDFVYRWNYHFYY